MQKELQKNILNLISELKLPRVGETVGKRFYLDKIIAKKFAYIIIAITDCEVGEFFDTSKAYRNSDFVLYLHTIKRDMLEDSLAKFKELIETADEELACKTIDLWKMIAVYCTKDGAATYTFPSDAMLETIWQDFWKPEILKKPEIPKIGNKVKATRDFVGVPVGSVGMVVEDYGTGITIEWVGGTIRDGFDKQTELHYLEIVE
jgi:hypothetical protein